MRNFLWSFAVLLPSFLTANDHNSRQPLLNMPLDQLLNLKVAVASRGESRLLHKSPVPVEVISQSQLQNTGQAYLADALLRSSSSFHYLHFSLRDGSDHYLPFSLRGFNPNQTLVMINGKRLHHGALLHTSNALGRGGTSIDLNQIPLSAVKQVEILKDSASAQYGSDAIAGIINIQLVERQNNEVSITQGQTSQGDGEQTHFTAQLGADYFTKGFPDTSLVANIEYHDNQGTNRAGPDSRQQYFANDPRNDLAENQNPINSKDGDPASEQWQLNTQATFDLSLSRQLYAWFNGRQKDGRSELFFRRPLDDNNVRAIYPDGFLPQLAPDIWDTSVTLGLKQKHHWDISYTRGRSSFNTILNNSLNASLGEQSPTSFNSGRLGFSHHILSGDWVKYLDNLQIAAGAEFRSETFEIKAGSPASYQHGGVNVLDGPNQGSTTEAGAQGLPGFEPQNASRNSRNNSAVYIDIEYSKNDLLWINSLRYENYSDFGDTLNGKSSISYSLNSNWRFRASASNSFRAPSLSQSHYSYTGSALINNELVSIGTFSTDHPLAIALGAKPLEPETAQQINLGMVYQTGTDTLLSFDIFKIDVNDRIELTGNIDRDIDLWGNTTVSLLDQFDVGAARYFTNAISTTTTGFDIDFNHTQHLSNSSIIHYKMQYHKAKTRVDDNIHPPIQFNNQTELFFDRGQVMRIERKLPESKAILSAEYNNDKLNILLKGLYFSSIALVNDIEQPERDQTISGAWITDLAFGYSYNDSLSLYLGANNLFNHTPEAFTPMPPLFGEGQILQYADHTPYGINGRYMYLQAKYQF